MSDNTPTKRPHADLMVEWARQSAFGEAAAGWWRWESHTGSLPEWETYTCLLPPSFYERTDYRYSMTDKHPDYVPPKPKPKLKLIDMAALPKGSAVTLLSGGGWACVVFGMTTMQTFAVNCASTGEQYGSYAPNRFRIAEQEDFTYWGGGECPVPEGVKIQVVWRTGERIILDEAETYMWAHSSYRSTREIIAYRIIGVADGWTDDPEQAK